MEILQAEGWVGQSLLDRLVAPWSDELVAIEASASVASGALHSADGFWAVAYLDAERLVIVHAEAPVADQILFSLERGQ